MVNFDVTSWIIIFISASPEVRIECITYLLFFRLSHNNRSSYCLFIWKYIVNAHSRNATIQYMFNYYYFNKRDSKPISRTEKVSLIIFVNSIGMGYMNWSIYGCHMLCWVFVLMDSLWNGLYWHMHFNSVL